MCDLDRFVSDEEVCRLRKCVSCGSVSVEEMYPLSK